jgi:hypothetical protein
VDEEEDKENDTLAKSGVKSFKNLMRRFDNLLRAGVSWMNRLKRVKEEQGEAGLSQLQHHNIPFLKEDINLDQDRDYILTDAENEETNAEIISAETFDRKAMLILKAFVERWHVAILRNEEQRRQREQEQQERSTESLVGMLFRTFIWRKYE